MRYLGASSHESPALEFVSSSGGGSEVYDLGQLSRWAERYASTLYRAGVRKGDRVALLLRNSPELVVSLFGNHLLGAITVPINPAATDEEFRFAAEKAGIAGLVSGRTWTGPLKIHLVPRDLRELSGGDPSAFPECHDELQPALLCFSSGTTSRPKGVVLTHGNIRSNLADLIQVWRWSREDHLLLALPLSHVHGLVVGLHGWALTGCRLLLLEKFEARSVLDLLTKERPSLFMGVPTMYRRLVGAYEPGRHDLSGLRLAITGSAPMPVELHARCGEIFGRPPVERYGMTETLMNLSNPPDQPKAGCVGFPLPSVEVRLVDENLREIREPGKPGEVWVRGPNVFSGYWEDSELTRQAFVEGWFRTGDVGYRDGNGYYHLMGRLATDFIKSGGHRIGTREIEEVLERHPRVLEAAVVGVPDEDLGERVAAFVACEEPPGEEELLEHCRRHLAGYKCPRTMVFVDSLPRNSLGKISKTVLKTAPGSAKESNQ